MPILQNTTALQNEQTELQSLLESVNALPKAGSDLNVITGTFTPTSTFTHTISDLPFKPEYVEIMAMYNETSYTPSSTMRRLICAKQGTLSGNTFNEYVFAVSNTLNGTNSGLAAAEITFNDNGFVVNANAGTNPASLIPVTYSYLAIG